MVTQYDVEVYQRLEGLLGKKLPELKLDEETVLILHERVSEAQRLASREVKELQAANSSRGKGRKKGNRLGNDDDDGDGGLEEAVKNQVRTGYLGGSGGNGGAIGGQRGSVYKKKKSSRRR
jgi:ATP-dependent RNA helicase DDX47/RRP3